MTSPFLTAVSLSYEQADSIHVPRKSSRYKSFRILILPWCPDISPSLYALNHQSILQQCKKTFLFILLGLLIVRLVGKMLLNSTIDIGKPGGMFCILII